LTDQAAIDASGAMGGGQVELVGGDYQGQNPVVANAAVTYVGAGANIKADATEVGAGGTVIVWADDTTRSAWRHFGPRRRARRQWRISSKPRASATST
jgi:hypothetical protein